MNATDVVVGFMVVSMAVVLLLAWRWSGSLRTAFMVMLMVGKVWAGVLWAYGIDRPLFNIVVYNKVRGTVTTVTITASQFVFISFLATFVFTLAWPYIRPHIPEPLRRIHVPGGESR